MKDDPNEGENLADKPEYSGVLSAYKEKLRAAQEKTGDPWLMKWRYE
ncbi:MAG: hypothetical protein AAF357_10430 [Verrucomicrobiota bacterium]